MSGEETVDMGSVDIQIVDDEEEEEEGMQQLAVGSSGHREGDVGQEGVDDDSQLGTINEADTDDLDGASALVNGERAEEHGEQGSDASLEESDSDTSEHDGSGAGSESELKFGCKHYRRRAKIRAPCCNEVFWCRVCHNEEKNDGEMDPKKQHEVDRRAITTVICAQCDLEQPVAKVCRGCDEKLAEYVCLVCNFFDDEMEKKKIFHCDKCGICRVGGREKFFHCDRCQTCYAKELRNNHKCIERSMHQNCPVCMEFLFSSREPITVMRCGHTIHLTCMRMLLHSTYVCPLCSQSLVEMDDAFAALRSERDATEMPEEYRDTMVKILCNDCHREGEVRFHVVGQECLHCNSFNTRRL